MSRHFVEVKDPKDVHNYPIPWFVGDEPHCDYTKDEWVSMMEYYYEYEHPYSSKGR